MRHKTDTVRSQQLTHTHHKSTEIIVFFSDNDKVQHAEDVMDFSLFSDAKEERDNLAI